MNEARFNWFRSLALDGNLEGMAAMLDAGFGVNAVNAAHQTALMHCCANDRLRSAKFLLARGADVNAADHGGTTAMDFAVRHASRDLCDWLESAGGQAGDACRYARGADHHSAA